MKLYTVFAGLVLALAACVYAPAPPAQYAGIAVLTAQGKVFNAVVLEIAPSEEKCEADLVKFAASVGDPPIGVQADLSCVELAPFKSLSAVGANKPTVVHQPLPKTDSV